MDVEFELSQQLQGHESQVRMQGCRAPYEVFQSSNLDHFSIETHGPYGDLGIPHDLRNLHISYLSTLFMMIMDMHGDSWMIITVYQYIFFPIYVY